MASTSSTERSSRIPNFFRLSVRKRNELLRERGFINPAEARRLSSGSQSLTLPMADKMIENVVGVFGLPLGLALNFVVNGNDYVVPLVVEEPSIVAGLSGAARLARQNGGFTAECSESLLIGQVQVVGVNDPDEARQRLLAEKAEVLALANSLHPKMVARGGGATDIEVHRHTAPTDGKPMLVLHLLVDTRDAMGANLVNTMCEGVASLVERITGGAVFLRILSNLTDRAIARASVCMPADHLAGKGRSGEDVRDGIVLATDLAQVDPYRAATHNKGIMNGVDAVAIATGNDWRAIEAAAHAYAARDGRYRSLTRWRVNEAGDLAGEIEIPMKVGVKGGSLETNPGVRINHQILGVTQANNLAGIMAAVGLAQNFAALRALTTEGIQRGHMTLHARSVASVAGAPGELFEQVVEALIDSGEIKVWKAEEILKKLRRKVAAPTTGEAARASASAKLILFGEHAVVYGRPALALPIPLGVEAEAQKGGTGVHLAIPRWGISQRVNLESGGGLDAMLRIVLDGLGLTGESMRMEMTPHVPRAAGLGASAALAVAAIRAIGGAFDCDLSDEAVNDLAFECERGAHGTPSGIDNTVATYGKAIRYQSRSNGKSVVRDLPVAAPIPLVIGHSGKESLTSQTVAGVRDAWQANRDRLDTLFDQIAGLSEAGESALATADLDELGHLMNLCHGYLNALRLSTPELETLIHVARDNGALGAKLTGGGGGGAMIALCPDNQDAVVEAMTDAGFEALKVTVAG